MKFLSTFIIKYLKLNYHNYYEMKITFTKNTQKFITT